jgi:pyruvate-ferredoxin/flavodoxin oxidoreductase
VRKIERLEDDDLRAMMSDELISAHRKRALNPEAPVLRGTAQNPDVFFQAREACNGFYLACPGIVEKTMAKFGELTGRSYKLFEYVGHPQAERVIVMMGSGAEVAHETVEHLVGRGEKVGVLKVRLYRPFSIKHFAAALPSTVRAIAVLDRTKEPGAIGEPLYLDVVTAIREAREAGLSPLSVDPLVIGGRYGLSSKEFNPAHVKAVLDELVRREGPRNHFTVGIVDDVTHTSIEVDPNFDIDSEDRVRAVFFGLGADGTVGANKNSIKIIGEETENDAQGYFVYDSKKSGAITISHLRFGPGPIRSSYLIRKAGFVACHQFGFLEKYDMLEYAVPGGTFLLNTPFSKDAVWKNLPRKVQEQVVEKKLKVYSIDAYKVAEETGMGNRINSVMQTCFFAISGVLPREEAISHIKKAIEKTYGKKGAEVVRRNFASVDATLENLFEVPVGAAPGNVRMRLTLFANAPDFVKRVQAVIIEGKGDLLPVSAFPVDGTWPTATSQWEKRAIALDIPVWDEKICIQCNKCAFVCPHAAIRAKVYDGDGLAKAPATFKSTDFKGAEFKGKKYTIQVAPEDCTGCNLCVMICPAKDKSNPKHKAIDMAPMPPLREAEAANYEFFLGLPEPKREEVKLDLKGTQFLRPLFEYSGACAGCGETPYIKLMTQLFGDRTVIANATGCSSIYGGNLPTTPYTVDAEGRGPAWCNSLFEDNAEFGFGIRLAIDALNVQATQLLKGLSGRVGDNLVKELLGADMGNESGIAAQRKRVAALKSALAGVKGSEAQRLASVADYLVRRNVWIVGGDGWAYDIGYGGLDHVLSTTRDVNVLILDTEVYSNTGGQASKSTPTGAAAKFASAGKEVGKKDICLMAMAYGHVYVARVAFGAKDVQTVKAFQEAESYRGPSLILAYSHCIAHGYDMAYGAEQQKLAVDSGVWPLYRFDPRRTAQGQPPLQLDSGDPKISAKAYMRNETRFRMVEKLDPERFKRLMNSAEKQARQRVAVYKQLAGLTVPLISDAEIEATAPVPAGAKN